jgi:hypothetical protein
MKCIRLAAYIIAVFAICVIADASVLKAQVVSQISEVPIVQQTDSEERLPGSILTWDAQMLPEAGKAAGEPAGIVYSIIEETDVLFTGLAIGWKTGGKEVEPQHFELEIRSAAADDVWGDWVPSYGYLAPGDSPSGLYWAMLYVTPDGGAHLRFEVRITSPTGTAITYLRITAADARSEPDLEPAEMPKFRPSADEPDMPEIIRREGWWGNLPPGQLEPSYSPQQIDISHAAVHHTVTANEPPNPPQVVRQIWDWHVNDNGWLDIGYNFLIDHTGNVYQGRYNPWLEDTDVRGAHAGQANSSSVGIALLGQFEPGANPQVGAPASLALDALVKMISWRFTQKNIDPLGTSRIPVNPSGSQNLPTILGHRDVSATACPGENLYALLPEIRNNVEGGIGDDGDGDDDFIAGPFVLMQNYPNPTRGQTTIPFVMEHTRDIRIELYDVNGSRVRTLFEGRREIGEHSITIQLNGLASGVYFYEIIARDFRQMRQMVYFR